MCERGRKRDGGRERERRGREGGRERYERRVCVCNETEAPEEVHDDARWGSLEEPLVRAVTTDMLSTWKWTS